MKRLNVKWLWFAAFVAVWCALRIFWIDADAGIPSVWEYGYNVTDEGYYMGAAKDKLLRGAFNDLACNESFTYGYSAGTHWLSYLGCAVFGLNSWGFRVPFFALYLLAWCAVFLFVAARQGGLKAFLWCAAFSCMPVVVAYERTAGNDVAIAALTALAFCLAFGKGVWRIFVAALVVGAVILVKPSVWALIPIVASAVLSERKTRSVWLDLVLFVASSFAAVLFFKLLAVLSVWNEASAAGMTGFELIRRTTTYNALPKFSEIVTFLKGFSSFPRDPSMPLLSVSVVFISVVPLAVALRGVLRRRWSWRILLGLSFPAYIAGISVLNTIYTHYFHPVLILLPIVWCATVEDDGADDRPSVHFSSWTSLLPLAVVGVLIAFASLTALDFRQAPQVVQLFYSKVYNLPQRIVWAYNWRWIVPVGLAFAAIATCFCGLGRARRESWLWAVLAMAGTSVAFAALPAVHIATRMRCAESFYAAHLILVLSVALVFLTIWFVLPRTEFRRHAIFWFPVVAVVAAFLVAPSWRRAAGELVERPRHVYRDAGVEIATLVPTNAVVIGERSRQVLMGHPQRTATTMPSCDPMPVARRLFKDEPQTPVYGLLDSQNAYNLQHFMKHKDECQLQLIKTFKMPSFGNGTPADVHLCRIVPVFLKEKK